MIVFVFLMKNFVDMLSIAKKYTVYLKSSLIIVISHYMYTLKFVEK